mgnify:CR=1 FL=1
MFETDEFSKAGAPAESIVCEVHIPTVWHRVRSKLES